MYLIDIKEPKTVVSMCWANIWINSALIACLWLMAGFICLKGRHILAKIRARLATQAPKVKNPPLAEEYPLAVQAPDAGRPLPALDSRAAIWPILPSFSQCMATRNDF